MCMDLKQTYLKYRCNQNVFTHICMYWYSGKRVSRILRGQKKVKAFQGISKIALKPPGSPWGHFHIPDLLGYTCGCRVAEVRKQSLSFTQSMKSTWNTQYKKPGLQKALVEDGTKKQNKTNNKHSNNNDKCSIQDSKENYLLPCMGWEGEVPPQLDPTSQLSYVFVTLISATLERLEKPRFRI